MGQISHNSPLGSSQPHLSQGICHDLVRTPMENPDPVSIVMVQDLTSQINVARYALYRNYLSNTIEILKKYAKYSKIIVASQQIQIDKEQDLNLLIPILSR